MRAIICTAITLALLWAARMGLYAFLDAFGFWPFVLFCGVLTALIIAAAFVWDWHEARR